MATCWFVDQTNVKIILHNTVLEVSRVRAIVLWITFSHWLRFIHFWELQQLQGLQQQLQLPSFRRIPRRRIDGRLSGWYVIEFCLVMLSNTSPRLDFQIFDALIHFCYEGSWLYYSTFGRQVNTSVGPLAQMCTLSTLCPTLSFWSQFNRRERI